LKTIKNSTDIGKLSPLLTGIISGVLFGVVMSVILGVIYYFTPIKENLLPAMSLLIVVLSTFWAGKTAASMTGSKGLILGVGIGVLFFLLILIVSMVLGYTLSIATSLKKLLFCLVGGALGGIFGVTK
jgi:putative membrane protein (TIGR04086 family)